jgi:serine O-acetyltransferase
MLFERIREDIAIILERDPAARSSLEVILCYPGLHVLIFHRLAHRAWGCGLTTLARFISHFARWFTGIEIHPAAHIGRRVFIDHGMGTVIGETAVVNDDCTIYQGVTLGGTSLTGGKRHPTLLNGVVVGAGAKVLGPFEVGVGAKIGSNAVVTKSVPAGATAVGNPARIIVSDANNDDRQRREQAAERMGFSAYAVSQNADDPLQKALHGLIDHAVAQQARIEQLELALQRAGITVETPSEPSKPKDELQKLNRLVDE